MEVKRGEKLTIGDKRQRNDVALKIYSNLLSKSKFCAVLEFSLCQSNDMITVTVILVGKGETVMFQWRRPFKHMNLF